MLIDLTSYQFFQSGRKRAVRKNGRLLIFRCDLSGFCRLRSALLVFQWRQIINPCGGSSMKSEYPSAATPSYCQEDPHAPSSRLMDEKVSDDSGMEAKTNSALAPAGLKNTFWNKAS